MTVGRLVPRGQQACFRFAAPLEAWPFALRAALLVYIAHVIESNKVSQLFQVRGLLSVEHGTGQRGDSEVAL